MPSLDPAALGGLLMPAVSIAMLAAIESLLSARVAAGMVGPDGRPSGAYSPDRELTGQGLASVAAGFFGGMPATGAIARTAVNVRSGAKTRLSAIVHALVLLAIIYLAAGLVGKIPLAVLAGILMVTATRMVSRRTVTAIMRSTRADAFVFVLTALITVAFDLIVAIEIGLVAAAIFTLRKFASLSGVKREEIPGPREEGDEHIAIFRLDGAMFFGAAERVLQEISQVKDIQVAIIRLSQVRMLDATGRPHAGGGHLGAGAARRDGPAEGRPAAAPGARDQRRGDPLAAAPQTPVHVPARGRGARPQPRAPERRR